MTVMSAVFLVFSTVAAIFLQPSTAYSGILDELVASPGTANMSSVCLLSNGIAVKPRRHSIVFLENKGGFTVQVVNGMCRYPAKVYPGGRRAASVWGYLEDNCTIRNAPVSKNSYRDQTYKVVFSHSYITFTSPIVDVYTYPFFHNLHLPGFGLNVSYPSVVVYSETKDGSIVLTLNGLDSISREEKLSVIYVESKGKPIALSKVKAGKCRYTAYVFAYRAHKSPVLGYLDDDCTIRNAVLDPENHSFDKTDTIYFNEGFITYNLQDIKVIKRSMSHFDQHILPRLVFNYTVFAAEVTAYATSDGSSVLSLFGVDMATDLQKNSYVYTGKENVDEYSPGRCKYRTKVYAHGDLLPPVWGFLKDSCTIRNAPLSNAIITNDKIYKIFFDEGSVTYDSKFAKIDIYP